MTDFDILNCDKWARDHQIPEVKNGLLFTSKSSEPDPEGLLSYEIFGNPGSVERKQNWGCIDLGNMFVHPHVLYELKRYQANYGVLVAGNEDFFVSPVTGKITMVSNKDPLPNGVEHGTGVRFLYKVWDKINFDYKGINSGSTIMRLEFFNSLKKEEVFMSKLPVIPAFYRDMNSNNDKISEINQMYRKVLTNAASLKATSGMLELFGTTSSDRKVQDLLLEIYQYYVNIFGGTKGFIHKNLMGKTTDFSARAVISMPRMDGNTVYDAEVDYETSAFPLATVAKCFAPFVKFGIKNIIQKILSGRNYITVMDRNLNLINEPLADDFMNDFNSDSIDEMLQLYDTSYEYRLEPFMVRIKNKKNNGGRIPLAYVNFNKNDDTVKEKTLEESFQESVDEQKIHANEKLHPLTITDMIYMATYNTCKDKCMYITRYPIEDQHNIYPTKMNIIPCIKTEKRTLFGIDYPKYPVLPRDDKNFHDLNYLFVDTVRPFPTYLKALGGDFDGDQISCQGVFTNEANEACRKYITSKINIVNVSGGTMREIAEVAQMGLYNLTYRFQK